MSDALRVMMIRSLLHTIATAVALALTFIVFAHADMPVRLAMYGFGWVMCGAAYLSVLYCKQYLLDAFDDRIRRVMRDQRAVEELRRYQRRLRFIVRWRIEHYRKKD